ncbi:unnamed protein product [Nyctereutes procyonoides]|uniref:(raccoon dog) hypothetical protein n=1 Tax=Nyctereutes procyonoides TaxID=34880 RepID=A0A811YRM9_NYCPR|nr:unnamed protein product [Nyctereutes procyonoides]
MEIIICTNTRNWFIQKIHVSALIWIMKNMVGDPQYPPHRLQVVTRIKKYKEMSKLLGHLEHTPQIHKNILSPLKLSQGLPTEEDMPNTCIKSTGESIVQRHLNPIVQEAVKS